MVKNSKYFASLIVIVSCITAVSLVKSYKGSWTKVSEADSFDRVKGKITAPIQIVEFIDFQCPACAQGALYLKDVIEKNPEAVRLEMKYFPLQNIHKHAYLSSVYAECAARQGKFWAYHDSLVKQQDYWKQLNEAKPAFDIIAAEVGLDLKNLAECLKDDSIGKIVEGTVAEGRMLGVKSTPTYYVNGKMLVGTQNLMQELKVLLGEHAN